MGGCGSCAVLSCGPLTMSEAPFLLCALTNVVTDRFLSGYSIVALMKCHEPKQLKEDRLYFSVWLQRDEVLTAWGSLAAEGAAPKLSAHYKQSERVESGEIL